MLFPFVRRSLLGLLLAGCVAPMIGGCERSEDLRPEDTSPVGPAAASSTPPPAPAPAPAPTPATRSTAIDLGRDVAGDLRRRAEDGDVQAMLVLGRFYESRKGETDQVEARRWYKRAADAGEASAHEALRNMDARENGTLTQDASTGTAPSAAPTTAPADSDPIDPTKTRWKDIIRLVDTSSFITVAKPDAEGQFMAISAAPD